MSDVSRKEYFELCREMFDKICTLRKQKKIDNHWFMVLGNELVDWSSSKGKLNTWDAMYFNVNHYLESSIKEAQKAFEKTDPEDRYFYNIEEEEQGE